MSKSSVSIGLLIAAGLLSGCDSSDDPTTLQPVPTETADVRFVHAAPDAPSVDVSTSVSTIVEDLGYQEAAPLQAFPAGTLTAQIDADVPGGPLTVIGPVDLELAAGTVYSVIAAGPTAAIDALVVTAPETSVAAGSVRAQVVHAAPQAPVVDVYVTAPDALLEQQSPIGTVAFGEALEPVEVPAGEYQIRVTPGGDAGTVVFDSGAVALPGGGDLLIVAVENDGPGAAPISLVVADTNGSFEVLDAAAPAELRAIHASPDAPPVDVIVNDDFDSPVLTNVPFGTVSDYLAVPPGTYNVKVTPTGNPGVIVVDANVDVAAGQRYSVYASGLLAGIAPYVLVDDNRSVATAAKVRLVHLAPSAGLVDIYVTAPGADIAAVSPTFAAVDFRNETGYVQLAGGEYDVTVTPAGSKDAAIGPATFAVMDGGVYTATAVDAEGGGAPFGVILLDDFVE